MKVSGFHCDVFRHSPQRAPSANPHVVSAARLIRDHAHTPVGIKQLPKQVPVSRNALFRRSKEHLGRSPKEELRQTVDAANLTNHRCIDEQVFALWS